MNERLERFNEVQIMLVTLKQVLRIPRSPPGPYFLDKDGINSTQKGIAGA